MLQVGCRFVVGERNVRDPPILQEINPDKECDRIMEREVGVGLPLQIPRYSNGSFDTFAKPTYSVRRPYILLCCVWLFDEFLSQANPGNTRPGPWDFHRHRQRLTMVNAPYEYRTDILVDACLLV